MPRQRVQPVRPERLSQIEAERPAISDLGFDAPKRLRRHVAKCRRDEFDARRPVRREAPPLVTSADSIPLAEVLGIAHADMRYRRPELLAPHARVHIDDRYRPSVQSFELAVGTTAVASPGKRLIARARSHRGGHDDECEDISRMRENSLVEKFGRAFGSDSVQTLVLCRRQALVLYLDKEASLADVRRAVEILEDLSPRSNRVLGPTDPFPRAMKESLDAAREKLAQAEAPVSRRTRSKAEES